MGCICCPLGNFISSVLYAIERIWTCASCAALVCCMLFTIVVACIFGTALGYHFCIVENKASAMDKATIGDLSVGGEDLSRRSMGPRSKDEEESPKEFGGNAVQRRDSPNRLSAALSGALAQLGKVKRAVKKGVFQTAPPAADEINRFKRCLLDAVGNFSLPLFTNYSILSNASSVLLRG